MGGKSLEQLVAEAKANVKLISMDELKVAMEKGEDFYLLDVRDPDEYERGRIPGAILLSRGKLEIYIDEVVPEQDAKIITYCGGGTRSALAANTLKVMGYENVYSLKEGFRDWRAEGNTIEM